MRVDTLTPIVPASPGETARCRVRVVNDGEATTSYRVRIVGFDGNGIAVPLAGPVPPGHAADVDVDIDVPESYAAGNHALALEVTSTRRGERPHLADLTLAVDSTDHVLITIEPPLLKARRSKQFQVYIDNREPDTANLKLTGSGRTLKVRLSPGRVVLRPGERARVRGKVSAPRRWFGDTIQHVVTIEAAGGTVPGYASTMFSQRPVFPRKLRSAIAFIFLLSLWIGLALGAVLLARELTADDAPATTDAAAGATTDEGGGGAGTGTEPGTDEGAAPGSEGSGQGGGAGGGSGEEEPEAKPAKATITSISGTVKAGKTGDDAGVTIKLQPWNPETAVPAEGTKIIGGTKGTSATKFWPAQFGRYRADGLPAERQTESIVETSSEEGGVWGFNGIAIRDVYELSFSKPGFDTQAFIITPPEDGKPVELEVELSPGKGTVAGVVTGPSGALGDVSIVVSDGTSTYTTTSSTAAGSTGRFEIAGIGTPANYTLSATRRGFGTEVLQIPLTPGQQRTDIRVTLVPGVGSVNGNVTSGGAPVGGVTISASTADLVRSTSSITQGAVGTYNIPQLPIPGDYTVSASAPGYITQTRLVGVNGNIGAVDFDLVRTTGAIIGRVDSSTRGALAGVAITITRDDLVFKTTSAEAPDTGAFSVDDLPPGEYVVDISRYDHRTFSRIVNLGQGQTLDLGVVLLQFQARGLLSQTGSVEVSLLDTSSAPVKGATINLIDLTDGSVAATLSDAGENLTNTFRFRPVDVGTYVVQVEAPGYQSAEVRVSVGLGPERVNIGLTKLGRAFGTVEDALTGGRLQDYTVTINRRLPNGTLQFIEGPIAARQDPVRGWEWQTRPDSLVAGTYVLDVTAPPGYRVAGDQILDAAAGTQTMTFVVPSGSEAPVTVRAISADPFPTLRGRLHLPKLASPTSVTFEPLNASPTIELRCPLPAGGFTPWIAASSLDDEVAPFPGVDSFTFTKEDLWQDANALGACELRVELAGYEPMTTVLATPLAPSDGVFSADQFVNVALFGEVGDLAGTVKWVDRGVSGIIERQFTAVGVQVMSDSQVIVGFQPSQGGAITTAPTPILATSPLQSTATLPGGAWTLAGQVFGQTTYVLTHPDAVTGRFSVTIDENGRQVAAVESVTITPDPLVTTGSIASVPPVNIEMVARPGVLKGKVTLLTNATPNYAGVGVSVSGPGTSSTAVTPNGSGSFEVTPAAAGMWQVAYIAPDHFDLLPGEALTTTDFIAPNGTTSGFDTTFYELGDVTVTVVDAGTGDPISGRAVPSVNVRHETTGGSGDPDPSSRDQAVGPSTGVAAFGDLPVNFSTPVSKDVRYLVSTSLAGYDAAQATVTIVDADGVATVRTGATDIPVDLRAGTNATVLIELPQEGAITASAVGLVGATTEPLPLGSGLVVAAVRVADDDGTPLSGETPVTAVADGDAFSISGPPGYYDIVVSHPNFEADPLSGPAPDPVLLAFRLQNQTATTLSQPFVLDIKRGRIDVTVQTTTSFLDGAPSVAVLRTASVDAPTDVVTSAAHGLVEGDVVVFEAVPGTALPSGLTAGVSYVVSILNLDRDAFSVAAALGGPLVDFLADGSARWSEPVTVDNVGHAVVDGLVPGSYPVRLVHRSSLGAELSFPVLVTIDVPRGDSLASRTATLVAPMPELGGSIRDLVRATNREGDAVVFPPSVVITRSYDQPQVSVGGLGRANDLDEGDLATVPLTEVTLTRSTSSPTAAQTMLFTALGAGAHEVEFPDADGYETPTPNPRDYTVAGNAQTTLGDFVYLANNVTVKVNVKTTLGTPITTATVRLVTPDLGETPYEAVAGSVDGEYVFTGIVPEMTDYTLTVSDELYGSLNAGAGRAAVIRPDDDGEIVLADVELAAVLGNIRGVVRTQDSGGTSTNPAVGVTVRLYRANPLGGLGTQVGADQLSATGGRYGFAVAEAGDYYVVASLAGYATRQTLVSGVDLGERVSASTLILPKLANVTVVVNGPASTDPSLAVTVIAPSGSTLTLTRSGREFSTTQLDPDIDYRFRASADFWYAKDLPSPTSFLNANIGQNVPDITTTLLQRVVNLDVTTVPDLDLNTATHNVRLFIPSSSTTPLVPTRTGDVFTWRDIPDGAGEIRVHIDGYIDRTLALADIPSQSSPVQNTAISIYERIVTVNVTASEGGTDAETATVTLGIPNLTGTPYTPTRTGSQYVFNRLPAGVGEISVTIPGYLPTTIALADIASATDTVQTVNATAYMRVVEVTVTASEGGTDAENATVTLGLPNLAGTTYTPTRDGTKYTFRSLPLGAGEFSVTIPGYLPQTITVADTTPPSTRQSFTVDMYMRVVTVNVTASEVATDAEHATVALGLPNLAGTTYSPTQSGAEYEFRELPTGSGEISVTIPGYLSQTVVLADIPSPTSTRQTVNVDMKMRVVTVTVETAENVTADEESATVTLGIPDLGGTTYAPDRTDNEYVFDSLPLGTIEVRVHIDDYLDQTFTLPDVLPTGSTRQTRTVTMHQRTLRVNVGTSDNSGEEESATVVVEIPVGTEVDRLVGNGTDDTYSFEALPGLDAGQALVSAAGYRPREVVLEAVTPTAAAQTKSTTLHPLVTIAGTVEDSDGNDLAGIDVEFSDGVTSRTATTDTNGDYTLGGFTEGTWTVEVDVAGEGIDDDSVVITETSSATETVHLDLVPRTQVFEFRVVDDITGDPVVGASVEFDQAAPVVSDTTDTNGEADPTLQEDELRTWKVEATGYITKPGLAVWGDTNTIVVRLVVRPAISGTVESAGPTLEPAATVWVCRGLSVATCDDTHPDHVATTSSSSPDAEWTIPNLDAGDYTVRARKGAKFGALNVSVATNGGVTPGPTGLTITVA